jgi:hypothetical protein
MAVMARTLMQARVKQTRTQRRQRARLAVGQKMMLMQQGRVVRVLMALLGMKKRKQLQS